MADRERDLDEMVSLGSSNRKLRRDETFEPEKTKLSRAKRRERPAAERAASAANPALLAAGASPAGGNHPGGKPPAGRPGTPGSPARQPTAGPMTSGASPSAKTRPAARSKPAVNPLTPASQGRALAETVVAALMDRLTAEAEQRGGALTVADIRAMNKEFEKKTEALQEVFRKTLEEYVRARERSAWDHARQYPFDRQLVKTFAHLFHGEGNQTLAGGALSRRLLPGFFLAINMMLGGDMVERYQDRMRAIVERVRDEKGQSFEWDDVYADAEAERVTVDALATIAPHFANLTRRGQWFIALVNGHLGDPDIRHEGPEAAHWQLTEGMYYRMLVALFAKLRAALDSGEGRRAITESHGAEARVALVEFLGRLNRAVAKG